MSTHIRRSLLISFGLTWVLLFLQFITSLIIARLLTPAELGVYSIVAILIGIGHTIRDLGVAEYIIQEKELNEARIRSSSLLTFLAAWMIGLVAWLMAGTIANFYQVPDLEELMHIMAINFFLTPFGSVVIAYLRRQLEFGLIAKIRLVVAITQALLSVSLAYLGFSYFSMAYSAVTGMILNILLVQMVRPRGFPLFPAVGELRHILSFGVFSSLRVILLDLDKGSPDLVLGRLMNMEAVGYFGRAAGLVDLFNRLVVQATSYVALPHFSDSIRRQRDVTGSFLKAITFLTGMAWPFYAFLFMSADVIVPVLYGGQWHAAIPLVQIISLLEFFLVPFYLQDQLAISTGYVRWEAMRVLASLSLRIAPLLVLPSYGLSVVVAGYAACNLLIAPISFQIMKRLIDIRARDLIRCTGSSFGVFMITLGALVSGKMLLSGMEITSGLKLATSCAIFLSSWTLGILIFHHPLLAELRLVANKLKHLQRPST
jgi:O-antigen/teichoic acid export membrane protein